MTLGERIQGLLRVKEMKATTLARIAGVQPSSLTRYASQSTIDVKSKTISALARALDVSTDYLLGARSDLDRLSFDSVAVRESFRAFQVERHLTPSERGRYEGMINLPAAPRTLRGWLEFDDLRRSFLGQKPRVRRSEATPGDLIHVPHRFRAQDSFDLRVLARNRKKVSS